MKDQDLKHRINGARETVKITRAMQLVSASKMTKAEKRMVLAREFLGETEKTIGRVGNAPTKLTERREPVKKTYIVMASDKGLCGDYNHKILAFASDLTDRDEDVTVYPVGHLAREYFKKRKEKVVAKYVHLMQTALTEDLKNFAYELADAFLTGKTDEVDLVFTEVSSSVSRQEPKCVCLLPVVLPEQEEENGFLEYKQDVDGILKQYIWAQICYGLSNAEYAVNYKSMTAMQQATTNGEELVENLYRQFNHVRQEKITSELMDACSSGNPEGR